jgi:hypothetical protein
MKTKLVSVIVAAVALCAASVFAQNSVPAPVAPQVVAPVAAVAPARAVQPVVICGACGEQIRAPRPVEIALPVRHRHEAQVLPRVGVPYPGQSFYGLPPTGFVQPYGYGYGGYPCEYRVPVAPRDVLTGAICAPAPVYYPGYYR